MIMASFHAHCITSCRCREPFCSVRPSRVVVGATCSTVSNPLRTCCGNKTALRQYTPNRKLLCSAVGLAMPDLITSEDSFKDAIAAHEVVVVDWMAKWCRKCIYLKPKLERMFQQEFPGIPLTFLDVNAVPGNLVYSNGIRKMPTIAVYVGGEKVAEHIAAEASSGALEKVRETVKLALLRKEQGTLQPMQKPGPKP